MRVKPHRRGALERQQDVLAERMARDALASNLAELTIDLRSHLYRRRRVASRLFLGVNVYGEFLGIVIPIKERLHALTLLVGIKRIVGYPLDVNWVQIEPVFDRAHVPLVVHPRAQPGNVTDRRRLAGISRESRRNRLKDSE